MENYHSRKRKFVAFRYLLTIILIGLFVFGAVKLYQRYSFTKEKANLTEYLGVEGDDIAIYVNDVLVKGEETENCRGVFLHESCYLPLSWIKENLNERFYYASDVKKILYSLPDETKGYGLDSIQQVANAPYLILKDEPYLLADFVKEYTNIRFDAYLDNDHKRIYIYTDWDKEIRAYMKSSEAARWKGGNKSPIIAQCKKGEEVKILDRMTKWSKVKTTNGYIGYVRNSRIGEENINIPKSSYVEQVRDQNKLQKKVCLGFHQVFSISSTKSLLEVTRHTDGMNVIAPTWYAIKNDEGDIRSLANAAYTQVAHRQGLEVWATLNNFDVADVDEKKIFGSTMIRKKMIDKLMKEVDINYLDGINVDIEALPKSASEDFTQFIRELSIACREKKIKLSIDTYVPYVYNSHYNLPEYSAFCDYVIIMCYDEHYRGSKEAGSVSSIEYVKDGINLSLGNVDRNKLVIALPFYTRIWTTTPDGKVSSVVYDSEKAYTSATNQGLKFEYDLETAQVYGSKTTLDGSKVEVWLEDETSLNNKMIEITEQNLAGTAAWKLTQQKDTFFEILNMN